MLNGQKLQGPPTAAEVNVMLKQKQAEDKSVNASYHLALLLAINVLIYSSRLLSIKETVHFNVRMHVNSLF